MTPNEENIQSHHCRFDILKQNMQSIYNEQGNRWISQLPIIVDKLRDHWRLTHITPVDNMTYHFVAKSETELHQKVVLKIGLDKKVIDNEKNALTFFDGIGAVKLLDFYEEYNALLLEQAVPGISLKSIYPEQLDFVIDAYCEIMKKLHRKKLPLDHSFPHIRDWLMAIDRVNKDKLPRTLLDKAIHLKNTLLNTMADEKFLHGDLHHDNILQHGNDWIIIDPKGVVGEIEFEAAAFDFLNISELANSKDAKK